MVAPLFPIGVGRNQVHFLNALEQFITLISGVLMLKTGVFVDDIPGWNGDGYGVAVRVAVDLYFGAAGKIGSFFWFIALA